ncbi:MAG: DUF1295 domain-containing protein [Gammaproteobacteria bacterium]|nr:DUF1295 domain-containing protein [Gammaproteobacteria bacterium]
MDRRIQIIFSVYGLVMLGILIYRANIGYWGPLNWAMLAVAATCCLLVFVRFVYVFNYSYALASTLNGLLISIWLGTPAAWLLGGAATIYGLRLLWFTWTRSHSESYAPRVANIVKADEMMPVPARISLWVMCTMLLTYHLMAAAFAGAQVAFAGAMPATPAGVVIGAGVMLIGTIIEGVADWQKQRSKNIDRSKLATTGLYRRWRHPNYAGEILLQLGLIIAGLSVVSTLGDAIVVVIAPSYIVLLMIAEARRVDGTQELQYGAGEEYRVWRANSGSLVPKLRE